MTVNFSKASEALDKIFIVRVDEIKRLTNGGKLQDTMSVKSLSEGDKIIFRDLNGSTKIVEDQFWLLYAPKRGSSFSGQMMQA